MTAELHGFELVRDQEISELNTTARLFRHKKTGAELLSLENEDENKVFGITFRTPVSDSTGVPHIMEHSVLCGSRKYPVKEPFVELMKGSLNTFLNAMTFPDKTCYPVASQNVQDFYNLIDVYMDSVFYPLITPYTFQQEGWHYEVENAADPLTYKGVVFNEMKGNYSSPDYLLNEMSQRSLYPDIAYGIDVGGDPEVIPSLTYEQFKRFHENYYHPSNARIFFYGDDDPQERLRRMDEYLKDFDRRDVVSSITLQSRFAEPRQFVLPYASGAGDEQSGDGAGLKSHVTLNWLLPEIGDPVKMMSLRILEHILVGTPASPLRKALIESGLGEDLAGQGLEMDLRQMFFSTGLKGIQPGTETKVEELVFQTLDQLAREGIDPETVAASLNTVEFMLRENNTGSFPRGLSLMLRSLTTWLHGKDAIGPLAFEQPLTAVKQEVEAGEPFFENLIREHLLNNSHRTRVVINPDPQLAAQRERAERQRLDQARAGIDEARLQELVENARELKRRQDMPDSPEALATIPMLNRSDLNPQVKRVPLEVLEASESQLLYHDLFTNGIVYLDTGFDLKALPQQWLPYVPLFGRALVEMGTQKEDFVRLSQRIGRSTGGIWPALFTSVIRNEEEGTAWLFLRSKSTVPQTGELLNILNDILKTVGLDNRGRFLQMVLEAKSEAEAQLLPMGHRVVNQRLRSRFNTADWASEQMNGVDQLFFLRHLVAEIENNWPAVLEDLQGIHRLLVDRKKMIFNVTLDAENWRQVQPQIDRFASDLPASQSRDHQWAPAPQANLEGLTIPAQVNYVGKGANLYELGYQAHGSILVASLLLRSTWLWENIRVKGGAYAAFSAFDRNSGVFTYLSYRDPNLMNTLKVYDQTGQFLQKLDLPESELTKSIIGAIGEMDRYQLPDAQGYSSLTRYLSGVTDEERQTMREQVLGTALSDLHALGEVLDQVRDTGLIVVLGSPESVAAANQTLSQDEARQVVLEPVKVL